MKGLPVFAIKDCFCIICENIQKRIPVRCQFRDWSARIVRVQTWLTLRILLLLGFFFVSYKVQADLSPDWLDKIEVEVKLTRDEHIFGEPIALSLKAKNLNVEPVQIWDGSGWYFTFTAKDRDGKLLKDLSPAVISWWFIPTRIPAGADFSDVTFLSKYIEFPRPDEYTVTYEGAFTLQKDPERHNDPDRYRKSFSDTIRVKIRKGSDEELQSRLKDYIKLLKSEDDKEQNQAVQALSASNPQIVIKLLRETLEAINSDEHPLYISDATRAIGRIGTDEAVAVLLEYAKNSENITIRKEAIDTLSTLSVQKKIQLALTDWLLDSNARIRIAALSNLGRINAKDSIPQIESLLNDPDEDVRTAASETLEKLKKPGVTNYSEND